MDFVSTGEGRMKKASIDIGTNSVLLLAAEVNQGEIKVLEELQSVPRLGKGVDQDKNLHPHSQQRVVDVLKTYQKHLEKYPSGVATNTIVTATSAVRDALNKDEFLHRVKKETGWDVLLLSGTAEAEISYRGALSVLKDRDAVHNVILDIGGGSTEVAYGKGRILTDGFSMDMGSVRFTERFLKNELSVAQGIKKMRLAAQNFFANRHLSIEKFDAVGVAGTVTSIAAIQEKLNHYKAARLNGSRLSADTVQNFIREFSELTPEMIEEKYQPFLTGRGDVILAGLIILDEFLKWCDKNEVIVSTGGIRHGILLE